ncbi:MAG: hypothetical protein IPO69_22215 [Saprospiraceae bacterium]|nr:hypothetical protein [Saprospiraceae bacterium]
MFQTRTLEAWKTLTKGAFTNTSNGYSYYNWYAATNPRNIAPLGWHVPTRAEWVSLIDYLGGIFVAGSKLKAKERWLDNSDATNSSGFTAYPAGYLGQYILFDIRLYIAKFEGEGTRTRWWGSTNPWSIGLNNLNGNTTGSNSDPKAGLSIRCILDKGLQINIDLTTKSTSSITSTSAFSGGNITNSGLGPITSRGVCYSTSPLPNIANNLVSGGTGIGMFTCSLIGLSPGTSYYVRAFATNSSGTAYGNEERFTTATGLPPSTFKLQYISGNAQTYPGGGMPQPMVFRVLNTASNTYLTDLFSEHLTITSSSVVDLGYEDAAFQNANDYCNDQSNQCFGGYYYIPANYTTTPFTLFIKVSLKLNGVEIDFTNLTENIKSVYGLKSDEKY